jgi:hypothetical protein
MRSSARLFNCAGCHRQVVICSHCDRSNRYCGPGCAQAARRRSVGEAGRRYQNSRRGRFAHAARQRRYRQRRKQKVTHQGSPPTPSDETLPVESSASAGGIDSCAEDAGDGIRCHFCARICTPFVRQQFLHRPVRDAIDRSFPASAQGQGP